MQCDDGMCGDVMMNEQTKTFDIDDASPRGVEDRRNDVDYVCRLILLQFAKISMYFCNLRRSAAMVIRSADTLEM